MRPDAYIVDRRRVYSIHGSEYYSLRGVTRSGATLMMHGSERMSVSDDQFFVLEGNLPATVIANGSHMLIPIDDADRADLEFLPWHDLPDRPGRKIRTPRPPLLGDFEDSRSFNYLQGEGASMTKTQLPPVPTVETRIVRLETRVTPDSAKAKLLRRALALVATERENGSECHDVVEKACAAEMFDIAEAAADSCHEMDYLGLSLALMFREFAYWQFANAAFIARSEKRLLPASEGTYGWRSLGLGFLGTFRLLTGEPERAKRDWEAANNVGELDSGIRQAVRTVAEIAPEQVEDLLEVADVIRTRSERANLLVELSEYVE